MAGDRLHKQYRPTPLPRCLAGGFTLVELLVVVAIIALLMAVLMPSLRRAKRDASRTVCTAHLREIVTGWHMYVADHDGYYLKCDAWPNRNWNYNYGGQQGRKGRAYRWPKPLNPYLGLPLEAGRLVEVSTDEWERKEHSADVFACPNDEGHDYIKPSSFEYYGTSYIANLFMIGTVYLTEIPGCPINPIFPELKERLRPLTDSEITVDRSKLIMFGDYGWHLATHFGGKPSVSWHGQFGAYNLAFLDGHVGFVELAPQHRVTSVYTTIPFRDLSEEADLLEDPVLPPP